MIRAFDMTSSRLLSSLLFLFVYCGSLFSIAASAQPGDVRPRNCHNHQRPLMTAEKSIFKNAHPQESLERKDSQTLPAMISALDVQQGDYFAIWQGLYPTAIDWTAAVLETYVSGALSTISKSYAYLSSPGANENTVNKYFSQVIGYYFGQDAFALRQEAYDDMLWVVLGWLEAIKFIDLHSQLHYSNSSQSEWYGKQYTPAFAHRARLFWELASQGWDTTLCGGGMIWSPYLLPYKNAITNELYIAASISMYLYFPGDSNASPFISNTSSFMVTEQSYAAADAKYPPRDPKYLKAATDAYKWLMDSNMTNAQGLYVDGYHISNLSGKPGNTTGNNTRCDARNEMAYTYNQGVLLTGQRGLYEATGNRSYLEDGHKLVSNVINATGYDLSRDTVISQPQNSSGLAQWYGLGRNGILEDTCDSKGDCSQDGQTFKGIYFHHFTSFCTDFPAEPIESARKQDFERDRLWHGQKCLSYAGWIKHNAEGALSTKNTAGKFGNWWGVPAGYDVSVNNTRNIPEGAVDYRNMGIPKNALWLADASAPDPDLHKLQKNLKDGDRQRRATGDPNDQGRGRTVETQGGGVSVLRSLWEIVDLRS